MDDSQPKRRMLRKMGSLVKRRHLWTPERRVSGQKLASFLSAIASCLLASCVAAGSFQPADLTRITLRASDTPLGLRYDPEESGFLSRTEMIDHIEKAARLGPKE